MSIYENDCCRLCPVSCGANREAFAGRCGVKNEIKIAKYYAHPFEEPIISNEKGSGTVFFCGCSLRCVFCQNYEVSRAKRGKTVTVRELVDIFKRLEDEGVASLNLVTPTHYATRICEALDLYKPSIPVVYNTHGYEKLETLKYVDKYVDVYMPDLKFFSKLRAKRYCGKEDYFPVALKAVEHMIKAKPCVEENGLLKSGVIVRHLVLPSNVDETKKILSALRPVIGDAYLSLMSQYTPFGEYEAYPELKRKITRREYAEAKRVVEALDFKRVYYQSLSSRDESFIPSWDY